MDLSSYLEGIDRRDWQRVQSGTVRIAMIGVGWWTRDRALPAIAASDLCEATLLVSGDREKAQQVADESTSDAQGITYEEFHGGAATESYDAVYICTPNAVHLPFAETAAGFEKHVLCEKPMEASVERARRMIDRCDEAGVQLMIGYRMQTEPLIRRSRSLVRDRVIGEPALVHGHMSQRLLEMIPNPDQWRLDPALAGHGTSVTDLGVYPVNTARFVLGRDPVSVVASMHSAADGFDEVPDERAAFELEFEDGILAACSASQNAFRSGRFEVIGTAGRLAIDPTFIGDAAGTLVVEREEGRVEIEAEPVDQMTEEFDYFADRILDDSEIGPDGHHGLVDMLTLDAIYTAASTGERVDV